MNAFAAAARSKKAAELAAYLAGRFEELAQRATEIATDEQWEAIAADTGNLPPSEKTRAEVRRILEGYDRARLATAFEDFSGFVSDDV